MRISPGSSGRSLPWAGRAFDMITEWTNCYDDSWKAHIVPEAFAHPAKMAYGLLGRILAHAAQEGWIAPGGIIVDPFGGIGSTGILGAYEGYLVVCVELEQKFVDLAEQNFKLHDNAWRKLGCPRPVMVQGDSRDCCRIIEWLMFVRKCSTKNTKFTRLYKFTLKELGKKFNKHPCTIWEWHNKGILRDKLRGVDCIISSPPYEEGLGHDTGHPRLDAKEDARRATEGCARRSGYGNSPGNIAALPPGNVAMVLSSPPFMLSDNRDADKSIAAHKFHGDQRYSDEKASMGGIGGDRLSEEAKTARRDNVETIANLGNIVSTGNNGQLINQDTFWSAAKQIVEQCHQILRPGGVAIWVVKSFVRKGKLVDFPGDWRRLCEAVGFETIHEHHASLVKEDVKDSLFGGTITKRKSKKSFFRRLCESKGSPEINWETVLCMRKTL